MSYKSVMREYAVIRALTSALNLLDWDQSTYMPKGCVEARANTASLLTGLLHTHITSESLFDDINNTIEVGKQHGLSDNRVAELKHLRRICMVKRRVPAALAEEMAGTSSLSIAAWEEARDKGDDSGFLPLLKKSVLLAREYADAVGYEGHVYNALLDRYERDLTCDILDSIFEPLATGSIELLEQSRPVCNDSILHGDFPEQEQVRFGEIVLSKMGLDRNMLRQDCSTHPFTQGIGGGDVRITTRVDPNFFSTAFYASVHEGGHALYEQVSALELGESPFAVLESLSLHESQSRFYENIVCRSLDFWKDALQDLKKIFPGPFGNVTAEQVYTAVNAVTGNRIRVEADELSYNLHIILRYNCEKILMEDPALVPQIESIWNDQSSRLLGFKPADKSEGYLQDIHWSAGLMGYFPTYTLGNCISAMFYNEMIRDEVIITGKSIDFKAIKKWMTTKLYLHGSRYNASEMVERVCHRPVSATDLLEYLQQKVITLL
jgi:carboxypeptidase Taq